MVQRPKNIHGGPGFDTAHSTGSFLDFRITFHKKDVTVAHLRPDAHDDNHFINATGERSVTLAIQEAL
jgi:hypothetical protein